VLNLKTQPIAVFPETKKELELLLSRFSMLKPYRRTDKFLFETEYRGAKILVLATGVGAERADHGISKLLEKYANIGLAVFLGFTGALEEDFKVGDIIIPFEFFSLPNPGIRYQHSPEILNFCKTIKIKNKVYLGEERIRLKKAYPAISSIDMESFMLAKRFSHHRIPFIIAKAISDEWDFTFHDFESLLDAQHESSAAKFLLYCIRYPREILSLVTFVNNIDKAFNNDITFLMALLDALIESSNEPLHIS
jgi:nucleoside phosphorylase